MNETELREAMARYKFYHIIKLTDSIATPGNPAYVPIQNLCMKHLKTLDLKGKRVLDIGCRDGLFCFAAESMGAAEVVGIDNDLSKPATEFLIPYFKSKVQMHQMNMYDLTPERFGRFDVVIFPGVLYHLRYPFWGLKVIRDILKPGGHLIVETGIWLGERNNAMLFCPVGDASPYEPTSCTFFNEKGLLDTLASLGFRTLARELLSEPAGAAAAPPAANVWRERALHPATALRNLTQRLVKSFVAGYSGDRPPNEKARWCITDRFVAHCTLAEVDHADFLARYWDTTHDFHTEHGG